MFLLMSWLCLLVSCTHVDAEHECIRFSVPMMNNLTVAENTTKNISFQVINECSPGFNFTFDVQHGKGSTMLPVCLGVGPNKMHQGKCTCVKDGQNLSCNLTAMFDRNKTMIIFESGEFGPSDQDQLKSKKFSATVTYPPTITLFTLGGSQSNTVDANEHVSIQAVCSWENGNPRRRMLLRNPESKIIYSKVPMATDQDTFRPKVFDKKATCSDTGLYVCEAEGTSVKESVFLRIRCPPQFWPSGNEPNSADVFAQAEAQFDFNILSSQNITKCTLAGPWNITRECKDIPEEVSITGSPPKLKLTVVFRNVSEEDSGTWQLSVENGFSRTPSIPKAATVMFMLDVIPPLEKTEDDDMRWKPLMIICCVVAVAALGLCVIITVCYRSRKKSKGQDRGVIIRTGDADTQGGGRQDRGSGSHFYEEIPEIPRTQRFHHHGQRQIPQPRGSPALPPTPAVDTKPGDYLHPVDNTPSTSGTNQSAGASAAPAGPYDSLEMSDMGLRSPYSQLGM